MTLPTTEVVYEDEDGEEYILEQEVPQEEADANYDAEFEAQWGENDERLEAEPNEDEELEDEESDELDDESGEQGSEQDDPDDSDEESEEATDDTYSWIDSLPEEVKDEAERLKHSAESDRGRISAYNRQLRDLREELDRMKSRPAARPAATGAPATEPAVHELPEKFKQLKEDFPEFAEAVDSLREYDREQFEQQLEAKLQPLEQDRVKQQQHDFNSAVDEAANEIFNTNETGTEWRDVVHSEDFTAWLQMQPRSVKEAATKPDPAEAINVLSRYESDYQAAVAIMNGDDDTDVLEENNQSNEADELKAKRTKRKKGSVAPGSKPIIADPTSEGGNYEDEFNAQWG